MPDWAQHRAALNPYRLAYGHRTHWADQTKPLPFAVDSKGPFFLEFQLIAAKAPNGVPRIGLVDAASKSLIEHGPSSDLSRSKDSGTSFAMSLDPGNCVLHASMNGGSSARLHDSGVNPNSFSQTPSVGCYRATLNWPVLGNESLPWNIPIQAGFFAENGNLTFYRMSENGSWRSTGILCRDLPEKVLPCAFMYSFVGYARLWFVRIWDCPPDICQGCDRVNHGTKDGWTRWR